MYSLTANVQQLRELAIKVLDEADVHVAKSKARARWGKASVSAGVISSVPFR